jgi:hypothetical protein
MTDRGDHWQCPECRRFVRENPDHPLAPADWSGEPFAASRHYGENPPLTADGPEMPPMQGGYCFPAMGKFPPAAVTQHLFAFPDGQFAVFEWDLSKHPRMGIRSWWFVTRGEAEQIAKREYPGKGGLADHVFGCLIPSIRDSASRHA